MIEIEQVVFDDFLGEQKVLGIIDVDEAYGVVQFVNDRAGAEVWIVTGKKPVMADVPFCARVNQLARILTASQKHADRISYVADCDYRTSVFETSLGKVVHEDSFTEWMGGKQYDAHIRSVALSLQLEIDVLDDISNLSVVSSEIVRTMHGDVRTVLTSYCSNFLVIC